MLLMVDLILTTFYILLAFNTTNALPKTLVPFGVCVVGLSVALHLANRILAPRANAVFVPLAVLLNGIGFLFILRWNPLDGKVSNYAILQAIWTGVSIVLYTATLAAVRRSRDLDRYRFTLLLLAIALMLSPLIPHVGETVNGARLWVRVGSFSFQPIEFAKILLCIFFASYFADNRELLSIPTARIGNRLVLDPRPLVPILAVWALAMVVIAGENDIGFALLIFTVFLSLLWVTTGRWRYLVFGFSLFVIGAYTASKFFAHFNSRIDEWLHAASPAIYHEGGAQLVQGWFSLAAGGVTGTGIGSHASLVSGNIPEISTDMIFASIGEELGLLGAAAIVVCYLLFAGSGLRTAQRARSVFSRLVATALTLMLGFQAFFIMAGVLRLLPLTGVTLPFVARGGSSLMADYVLMAILMRISDEEPGVEPYRPGEEPPTPEVTTRRARRRRASEPEMLTAAPH